MTCLMSYNFKYTLIKFIYYELLWIVLNKKIKISLILDWSNILINFGKLLHIQSRATFLSSKLFDYVFDLLFLIFFLHILLRFLAFIFGKSKMKRFEKLVQIVDVKLIVFVLINKLKKMVFQYRVVG